MRIVAFDVRPDEQAEFERQAARTEVSELVCHPFPLTAESVELVRGFDAALILGMVSYDEPLLSKIAEQGLRVLVTRTIGTDHIDLAAAERLGISVSNTSYAPDSVADFTLMLMLVALRKYKPMVYRQNVNDFSLPGLMGRTLGSLTVGVVGTGRIGTAVARRLVGFGSTVLGYDPHTNDEMRQLGEYVSLDELFRRSDIITFHAPSTPENYHMVRDETLARMRDGVVLVNTARASLMDVNTLVTGIESGKIGALAMDVFAGEDEIYHASRVNDIIANRDMAYLRQFPNTVLTQHVAFYTQEAVNEMVSHAVDAALRLAG
ncbi:MAG TPA: lactate dehydrogenase [Candidatus Olsenella pullicola]|nr:lactate dehydrogenase [Candidatus Olsenella pullicola]